MTALDHLSYSSIKAYLDCARNWKFKYIENQPTVSSPALVIGSAIHKAVEGYLVREDKGQLPIDFWASAWQGATEGVAVNWNGDTPEQHYNEGVRLLSNDQVIYNLSCIHAAKIEERVDLHVPGVPVPVIGYIDIQTDDGVPGDFKTSARSWSQEQAEKESQSLFYLAALNQAGRSVPGWRFRHYVMVKTKTPQWQTFEHTHQAGELFLLFSMIQSVWRGIEVGVFPENFGTWKCSSQYCDFFKLCRGKYI
jgi:putative RecB family exonuclease